MRKDPSDVTKNNQESNKLTISDTKTDYIKYDNTRHPSRKSRSNDT